MAFKEAVKKAKKKTGGSKNAKHPGFKGAMSKVKKGAGDSIDDESAAAIVAAASRNASPEAKKKNPRLKKVK